MVLEVGGWKEKLEGVGKREDDFGAKLVLLESIRNRKYLNY